MSLHLEGQYLQRTAPRVGSLMDPMKDDLQEAFSHALFGGEEVSYDLGEILVHSMKCGCLRIPDPHLLAECAYNTSKAASEILVVSILGGTNLNFVAHKV